MLTEALLTAVRERWEALVLTGALLTAVREHWGGLVLTEGSSGVMGELGWRSFGKNGSGFPGGNPFFWLKIGFRFL